MVAFQWEQIRKNEHDNQRGTFPVGACPLKPRIDGVGAEGARQSNNKETYLMNTDMDMTHSDGAEMDAGANDLFSRDTAGLVDAIAPEVVVLQPDEVFELRAEQVRKRINDASVKMLAYNRSIPGPTLSVKSSENLGRERRNALLEPVCTGKKKQSSVPCDHLRQQEDRSLDSPDA
jgi:hypothetical protein